ncbi:MAG TPA: tetratricopeptide repeat protein [Burkholderiales bacterium]|nr:tetratricopeptide repeat protein [Burkholderiales bacterium]
MGAGALFAAAFLLLGASIPVHAATIVELWNFSDPDGSERRFRDAMRSARGDLLLELETQIARTYSLRGRFADAHQLLDQTQPQLKDAGPKPRLRYLLERGRTFNSSGDKGAARPLFVEAWELARAAGEEDLAIDAAHMVAIVDGGERAVEWNLMALSLAVNAKDAAARRWKASLLNNIGYELKALGRYEEALGYFEQALAAYQERGDRRSIRIARWMIANALRLSKRYDAALAIQLALEKEFAADGEVDGYVLEEIAELYESLGDRAKARPYFRRAAEELGKDSAFARDEAARLARLRGRAGS